LGRGKVNSKQQNTDKCYKYSAPEGGGGTYGRRGEQVVLAPEEVNGRRYQTEVVRRRFLLAVALQIALRSVVVTDKRLALRVVVFGKLRHGAHRRPRWIVTVDDWNGRLCKNQWIGFNYERPLDIILSPTKPFTRLKFSGSVPAMRKIMLRHTVASLSERSQTILRNWRWKSLLGRNALVPMNFRKL